MLSREDNELVTRVGAEAPLGRLVRRYWLPALLSSEIAEPDGPGPAAGRIPGGVPRYRGADRAGGGVLRPPPGLAVSRPQRGTRAALHLPRLEIRRQRALRRHADRAARNRFQVPHPARRLSDGRARRRGLGLSRRRRAAGAAPLRMDRPARRPAGRHPHLAGMQLAAGAGRRDRQHARLRPAYQADAGDEARRAEWTVPVPLRDEVEVTDYGHA